MEESNNLLSKSLLRLRSYLKKIPGFRSGSKVKAVIASIIYLLIFLFALIVIIPTAPSLKLDEILPTNQNQAQVSGKTYTGKPVWLLRDSQVIAQTTSRRGGFFNFTAEGLIEGVNRFIVKVCNGSEQEHCREEEMAILVDQTAPRAPVIDSFPIETGEETVTIKGTSEKESEVRVFVDNEEKVAIRTSELGVFKVVVSLGEGENKIKVKAVDQAGNQSEFSNEVVITFNRPPELTPTVTSAVTPTPVPPASSSETSSQDEIITSPTQFGAQPSEQSREKVKVTRVIDGDTIELEDGRKVRYIGIDTPETVHPDKPVECYGQEASNKNKELVHNKEIEMEKDVSEVDKYSRLLRYIWVGNVFVNDYLVRQGYANSSTYPPDVKYQEQFNEAEREARENNRGLWGPVCAPEATPTLIPTPAPTPTPVPQASNTGNVTVAASCSQFDAPGDDHENLNEEYVCFYNGDSKAINMQGWKTYDVANHIYAFPAFSLKAGATVVLHTGSGANTATSLYWGSGSAIWNNTGDTVYLKDSGGNLVSEYSY
ncbi:thermonuclease family protein [Patescibacteria group bacterium]|nr:thermonuclease family protein [Patescibacteria group bacterium]